MSKLRAEPLKYLAIVLLVGALGFVLVACGGDDDDSAKAGTTVEPVDISLALDWFPWAEHSGIYLAQERGYFADEGLNVNIHVPANPEDGLRLAGSGEEDFAISYEADVLIARGQDVPVQSVMALAQHPFNAIMSLKTSNITRPADLKGKKVGYAGTPSDEALLGSVLKADGLTSDDVEMVNVGFSLAQSLVSKQVDAVIGAYPVYETYQIEQQGVEVASFPLTDWGVPDYYELVLVSGDQMVEQNADVVQRMVRAMMHGYQDAEADPDAALSALLANAEDADREVEQSSLTQLPAYWTDNDAVPFGTQTEEVWKHYADWLKSNDLLDADVNAADAFTNKFVERSAESE